MYWLIVIMSVFHHEIDELLESLQCSNPFTSLISRNSSVNLNAAWIQALKCKQLMNIFKREKLVKITYLFPLHYVHRIYSSYFGVSLMIFHYMCLKGWTWLGMLRMNTASVLTLNEGVIFLNSSREKSHVLTDPLSTNPDRQQTRAVVTCTLDITGRN